MRKENVKIIVRRNEDPEKAIRRFKKESSQFVRKAKDARYHIKPSAKRRLRIARSEQRKKARTKK